MADKFVLVVSNEKGDKHGEISELDTAHETERLVETLLEAGIDQERIRVFEGSEAEFQTIYRPVVTLIDTANPTTELERPANYMMEPEATQVEAKVKAETVEPHSGNGHSMSAPRRSARDDARDAYISANEATS